MRTSITHGGNLSGLLTAARPHARLQLFLRARIALAHRVDRNRLLLSHRVHAKPQDEQQEEGTVANPALVSALTTIGLSGTIAVGGATLSGYQIFNLFRWNLSDIVLAIQFNLVLLLLEALLFAPKYETAPSQQPAANIRSNKQDSVATGGGSSERVVQQQQQVDMAAVRAAGVWSVSSWQLMLSLYRAVLWRPAAEQLPATVNLGLVLARETSKELLQRGFILTALAGWLADRFYEAGLDDVIPLGQGLELTLPQLGFWAASLIATALFTPVAFIAAEEASESVSGVLLLRTEVGQAVAAASSGSSSSSSKAFSSGTKGNNTSSDDRQAAAEGASISAASSLGEQQQQQPATAGDDAAAAADDDDEEEELDPLVLEYRLFKVTEECVASAPAKIAYGLTLAKELARLVLANVSFVVTGGNLAASWSSSVLLNSMLMVYAAAAGQQQQQRLQQQTGDSSSSNSSSG